MTTLMNKLYSMLGFIYFLVRDPEGPGAIAWISPYFVVWQHLWPPSINLLLFIVGLWCCRGIAGRSHDIRISKKLLTFLHSFNERLCVTTIEAHSLPPTLNILSNNRVHKFDVGI